MTPSPKKGPTPHGYVDIHIDLPRALRDWAKAQPEGVSALVRRLLHAARQERDQAHDVGEGVETEDTMRPDAPRPPLDMGAVGQRVQARLLALERTQKQVAAACGLDPAALSELELGDREDLRVTTLCALAQALDLSTDVLLGLRMEDT